MRERIAKRGSVSCPNLHSWQDEELGLVMGVCLHPLALHFPLLNRDGQMCGDVTGEIS